MAQMGLDPKAEGGVESSDLHRGQDPKNEDTRDDALVRETRLLVRLAVASLVVAVIAIVVPLLLGK